jgi:hypothetical protein
MKKMNKKLWIGIPVIILVLGIMLTGCAEPEEPATYKVWTGVFKFSADGLFGTLQDNQYNRRELTRTDFEWHKENNFQNSPEYEWTEDQIFSYLVGLGFSTTQAETQSAWLISVDHGLIGSRTGDILYLLLK